MKISIKGVKRVCDNLTKNLIRIKVLAQDLMYQLISMGLDYATIMYDESEYDGTKDVKFNIVESNGMVQLVASGKSVLFIEFGSGVRNADSFPRMGYELGEYGKGKGKRERWGYYGIEPAQPTKDMIYLDKRGVVLTKGNQPARFMYFAEIKIRNDIIKKIREVKL